MNSSDNLLPSPPYNITAHMTSFRKGRPGANISLHAWKHAILTRHRGDCVLRDVRYKTGLLCDIGANMYM